MSHNVLFGESSFASRADSDKIGKVGEEDPARLCALREFRLNWPATAEAHSTGSVGTNACNSQNDATPRVAAVKQRISLTKAQQRFRHFFMRNKI